MILRKIREKQGWVQMEYATTWSYNYDFILDAVQEVIDLDLQENLRRVAVTHMENDDEVEYLKEVLEHNRVIRDCPSLVRENAVVIVAGVSRIMEQPIQLVFFNGTAEVCAYCPSWKFLDDNGDHVFDNYMNSIEIKGYCRNAERETLERVRAELQEKQLPE